MPSFSSLEDKVQTAQLTIGYTFDNPTICMGALVTPGVALPGLPTRMDGHKELAHVGDAVLKLALTLDGYEARRSREFTSNILQTKASNVNLALVGRRMGLDKVVIVNPSQAGMVSDKVMANTVEALIGAVYLDSNSVDAVRPVLAAMGLDSPA
ncbi:ribonuclease III domain-containing protein [Aspergillus vadensis CBS 113365]|uniref:Ribonuclease III n=1 Tax=Aspergillus vadensis (strain CBS 113365 / IMI 142717 / IBT 24658) TaxID=1448311 RepID=A0A319BF45_ASPVC|nr:ribonuclease III [Aspergillus vadensis CBS 113365]PYH69420.1 ribonuclease III [Aspergillus vadensis CBS 113365]